MAKIPDTLLKPPDPQLRQVRKGDTVFADPAAMVVTSELDCYLLPTTRVSREKSVTNTLQVTRARDGFHVTVLGKEKWSPRNASSSFNDWISVASVREEYDPEIEPDSIPTPLKALEEQGQPIPMAGKAPALSGEDSKGEMQALFRELEATLDRIRLLGTKVAAHRRSGDSTQ
jgi:hypothetical protein